MNKFRLITILNNDEILNTGIIHHRAILRRSKKDPEMLIGNIADELSEIDGFENFDDEFALFFAYYIFWQDLSHKYNSLIESHKNGSSRYPM